MESDFSIMTDTQPEWRKIAQHKRNIQAKLIQEFENSSSHFQQSSTSTIFEHDSDMLRLGPDELTQLILRKQCTATHVIHAFIKRAIIAHQQTNCLTEILFEEAVRDAARLDDYFNQHGKLIGPLHGVPMTLKDQFNLKGYDSTLGYVGRSFKPASEDCVLVQILRKQGAVILAKSNLPQSVMWCETDNPLWGLTVHPSNKSLTPGGSTGGEGALLTLNGSCVGWGTDLGGSVRIPSHMVGLCALKPSHGRLPYLGVSVSTEGQEHVPSVIGPMGKSLASITTVTKTVIEEAPWKLDPRCIALPWRDESYLEVQNRPWTIGLLIDDGEVKIHPPVERVLREVAAKLQNADHEIITWDPAGLHQECIEIMDLFYTVDGCEDIKRDVQVGGEPFLPHVGALVNRGEPISVYAYWQLNRRKFAVQKKYLDKWEGSRSTVSGRPVDFILAPTMPHAAVSHRDCKWIGYTKVWNFLDYTALVLPAGKVSKELDPELEDVSSYQPRNANDEWNWKLYDLDLMNGLNMNVQLIGRRLEEEKMLGIEKIVESLLLE